MLTHNIFLAVLLATTNLWAEESSNAVRNPGFENVVENKPSEWTLTGAAALDNAQLHTGRMGLVMQHKTASTSTAAQTVSCGEGDQLAIAWIKTDGVEGAGARLRARAEDGRVIAESKPLTGSREWQRVTLPFRSDKIGPVQMELALAQSVGSAWFDDVQISEAAKLNPLLEAVSKDAKRENLALGKKYELMPSPNYEYCTDPGDAEQLTDGRYTSGYFWTQKSTVGWVNAHPLITIDLGGVQPIAGIMINSAGGGAAGAMFPSEIKFFVSDDNVSFHQAAQLTPRGLKQDGKSWYTHRFLADNLRTRGRYVMIGMTLGGSCVFTDEIEVCRGEFDPASVQFTDQPLNRQEMAFAQFGMTPRTFTRGHFPETPHVKWTTPLAGGPVKAVVLCFNEQMRDVAEIAQRLDLDYTPVAHAAYYQNEPLAMLMQEQIENALPTSDVMIVGGYRWATMPAGLLAKIKARVQEGMGLVCLTPIGEWMQPIHDLFQQPLAGDQGLLDFMPMPLLPGYHKPAGSHFHLAAFGKGRVAWVTTGEYTRPANSLIPGYTLEDIDDDANAPIEYHFASLNKLILWAAHRDSRRISRITASPDKVSVKVESGEKAGRLQVIARDAFFDPLDTQTADVPAKGGAFEFNLPSGPNGIRPVDVWFRDEKDAVLDFGSTCCDVVHEAKIGKTTFNKEFYAPGETIEVVVKLDGSWKGMRLKAALFDTDDRELAAPQTVEIPGNGECALKIPLAHPLTLAAKLYLHLLRGDTLLEKHFERVWIDLPVKDDYTFCGWYAPEIQPAAYYGLRTFRALGLDTYVSLPGVFRAQNAAWANVRHGPENVSRVAPQNKDDSLIQVPCLTDPVHLKATGESIEHAARGVRRYGVIEWSMGDESTLGGREYCISPTCLEAFRKYLQQAYSSLDALNESWGGTFKSWDEVVPSTREKIEKLGAWLDHRRFMESQFAGYHDWCRHLITRQIPAARVGISGTPGLNSYSGHDWWKLLQGPLTHLSGYGGVQNAIQRSFLRPGAFYTTFLGYDFKDNDEQRGRFAPWDLVFHGANGINYYTLFSGTQNCPLIQPDLSMTRQAGWFFEEIKELKAGLGRLFIAARYDHDGIAIHYSPASVHAATATGLDNPHDPLKRYENNLSNLGMILRESHYQYDFIHEEQMMRGDLSKYRALILPWSSAISPREAAAIRRFVEAGGVVIADSYCGVRDDHGKPQPMLDDLFGIRQPLTPPELEKRDLILRGERFASGKIPVVSGAKIQLAGGAAWGAVGETPAFIQRNVGKGRAVFLNCSFSNYAEVRAAGVAGEVIETDISPHAVTAPIRRFMTEILAGAGAPVPVPVVADKDLDAEIEISRLTLGRHRLLGLVRVPQSGPIQRQELLGCRLALTAKVHVYEARSGRYLGRTNRIQDALPRGVARVYALLPYKVESISATGRAGTVAGQPYPVAIRIRPGGWLARWTARPDTHVVHLSVQGPDGRERSWYADNVLASQGEATAQIPFAWNDPPGPWTITVKDILTGAIGTAQVVLRKHAPQNLQ